MDVPEEERSEQPPGAAQLWGVWDESPDSGREYWAAWNTSRAWRRVLKEVNSPKPKLIVHAHHNMPGLGDPYFVEQVMEPMRRSLSDKGCDMRLATILREPVAEITSLMLFNKVPQEEFVEKMEHHADAMSKYVTFNYETQWPVDFKQPGRTPWELGTKMLAVARDILSEFSLVGRTEDLDPFMRAVNQALGWPADLLSRAWRTGRENGEDLPPPYTPTAEQVEAVKAVNVFDSQLYHTFCAEPAEQPAEQTGEQAGEQTEQLGEQPGEQAGAQAGAQAAEPTEQQGDEQPGEQGALALLGVQPQKRASGLVAAASLAQKQAQDGGGEPNNCGLVDAHCVFGSLTTVPYRLSYLATILQSFETHERRFFAESAAVAGLQLVAFNVYVDQTTTESDRQRELARKHPWARLSVKPSPAAFGQGHSLNLALAALRASGATFWLKWEDAWDPQRPFVATAARLLGGHRPELFSHDAGRPIVDVNLAAVHFSNLRAQRHKAGTPPPTLHAAEDAALHLQAEGGVSSEREAGLSADVGFWRLTNASMQPAIAARCGNLRERHFEMRDPGEALEDYWPNWSLRPGITRASLVLEVGNFSTKPILWPYWFETIFACKYFLKHPETVDGFVILDEDNYTLRLSNDSQPG